MSWEVGSKKQRPDSLPNLVYNIVIQGDRTYSQGQEKQEALGAHLMGREGVVQIARIGSATATKFRGASFCQSITPLLNTERERNGEAANDSARGCWSADDGALRL